VISCTSVSGAVAAGFPVDRARHRGAAAGFGIHVEADRRAVAVVVGFQKNDGRAQGFARLRPDLLVGTIVARHSGQDFGL